MAEFQEEQLFRGAAQGQGFAPIKAPDVTPFLRENMEIADRNYARMVSTKKQAQESQVLQTQDLYKALGVFSTKALEMASTIGKAYIDTQIIEGKNKMRSYGKANNYGVSPAGQQEYDETKKNIQQTDTKLTEDANKLAKQGAPLEAINYIKSLGSYQQIGAIEYYLKKKGEDYRAAKDQFFSSTTHQLTNADGTKFTPSQIGEDPVKHAIATREFGLLYLANDVGIGQEFNPNNAAMSLLYEQMDKQDAIDDGIIRNRKAFNDAQVIIKNAEEEHAVNRDPARFIAKLIGLPDEKGNRRSSTEVLEYYFRTYLPGRYYAEPQAFSKQKIFEMLRNSKVSAEADPKQRSFAEFYANRVTVLIEDLNRIDVVKRQNIKFQQDGVKESLNQQLLQFILNEWDQNPDTLKAAIIEQRKVAASNGITDYRAEVADSYLAEAKEKQDQTTWKDLLNEAAKNRTLSVKDLTNPAIPAEVRKAFMKEAVNQDNIRARILPEEDVEKDFNTALKTALGDASLEANFIGLNSAKHYALRMYRQKVAEKYQALGAEEASRVAKQEVESLIIEGKDVFARANWKDKPAGSAPVSYWPRFTPSSAMAKGQSYDATRIKADFKKDTSIIDRIPLVPVPTLERVADQIRAGAPVDVPGIYRELGGDPVALLNRNLNAINRTERMIATPSSVIAQKTNVPSIRRLAQKARTLFDEQRVYAAQEGAVTDPRFMNPAVSDHITRQQQNQGKINPTTKTLTYSGNKPLYKAAGQALQSIGFRIAEHPDFGGVAPGVHSEQGYHPHGEAFDVTHHTGSYADSVAKTKKLKEQLRAMGLFREIIGPGDGDPRHKDHLHLGGLLRPITPQDITKLKKIFGGNR